MKMRLLASMVAGLGLSTPTCFAQNANSFDPVKEVTASIAKMKVNPTDWPMWGGDSSRNNTPNAKDIVTDWDVKSGKNIRWSSSLGSQTYGNPVVANGKVYVGTNNNSQYIKRYPKATDLGVLLCFNEADGKFLWQLSCEKLPTGRVHDWPEQGICAAPLVEGNRCWIVTSRGEVLCLDTEGFHDGKNDGPYTSEPNQNKDEADIVWKLDMMKELGISQHNMCSCSVCCSGDKLFVVTGNGVDEGHINIPAPNAPSFIVLDRNTGKVLWTDNSPGINVLHGQWSSPAYGTLGGEEQVIFPGGDGWVYSFSPNPTAEGKANLLWKFDANPKESKYSLGGRADRNHLIGTPVIYDGLVYIAVGEDPEHGEGVGHLYCIDPKKRGDVTPYQVFNKADPSKPIAAKRIQACEPDQGDFVKENPNSAMVWHFGAPLLKAAGAKKDDGAEIEKQMHRSCGTVAIKNDILFIPDFSGVVHCLNAKTGEQYWGHDMLSACWASPLIVEDNVYVGNEDGVIFIFKLSKAKTVVNKVEMGNSVYTTPIVANGSLFIANRTNLFSIGSKGK